MPSASELSTTPASNVTIGGVNMAEGCSPGGINDVLRYLAAIIATEAGGSVDSSTLMPKAGGTFTGDIARQGRGAYLHHAGSGQTSGQIYFLPEGSIRPAAAEGVVVFYYS